MTLEKPQLKPEIEKPYDIHAMDNIHTVLYAQIAEPFYTYTRVPWNFEVHKEVAVTVNFCIKNEFSFFV